MKQIGFTNKEMINFIEMENNKSEGNDLYE